MYIPLQGPNFIWHVDGYDKLSHFNLCIHGCIDGLVINGRSIII